ncbi:hypothetical protein DYB31_013831 [Aphanomyces astaci]|uniref:Chromo domain-containing protein n=1 Tax=Aphanomyces astaci TaxID=112090 RepID=A0A397EVA5_APHAT|nr:hypothetical protein DYB31_013831 [Aphanomyces astaci]
MRKKHMDELHEAMEQLYREVAATSAKKRRQARDRQAKSKAVQLQQFEIGNFVLVGLQVVKLGDVCQENSEYQALVYLLGLDEDKDSWNPVRSLYEDIPIVFRRWFTNQTPRTREENSHGTREDPRTPL